MSANKRPSTSSLRRYLTSRPFIAVADIRRRFGLEPDEMSAVSREGTTAYIGLPEREASKLQDLWQRDEIGVELSVEVHAPVVVGVYPMRIARFVVDQSLGHPNGHANGHVTAHVSAENGHANGHANGHTPAHATGPHTAPSQAAPRSGAGTRPPFSPARHPPPSAPVASQHAVDASGE